jgi:hypothetical protein
MVTTNGFPKSGNHALVKAVQLLGVPCSVNHLPFGEAVEDKHIFIKRDPRNIVCSWLRFQGMPVTAGMFITGLKKFQDKSFAEELSKYAGWLAAQNTLIVKYENLIQDATELNRIAAFLDVPYIEGAFENLPMMTRTWFADHSDFNRIWSPEVEAAWAEIGGAELLAQWGY